MPLMNWDSSLDVGVDKMNDEHQQILSLMNRIYDAREAGQSGPDVIALVDRLDRVTIDHFRDEVAYMEQIGYAGIASHKIGTSETSPYAFLVVEISDPNAGPWDFTIALRVTEVPTEDEATAGVEGKQSDADYVRAHIFLDDPVSPPARCAVSATERPSPAALALLLGGCLMFVLRRR